MIAAADEPAPDAAALWRRHRTRVMDVAYRLLGSITDTEDIAQEAYLRLERQDLARLDDVEAWLVTVTSRLCLDQLRSARVTRRAYVGPWLPEPLVVLPGSDPDPADRITLDDSVRLALLVVLERLSPAQRTAYVLHDVFGVPYDEIGRIVGRSPAACRQLASRARRRVRDGQRFSVERDELRRVVEEFRRACAAGDVEALAATLDPDVTGEFDSGGLLPGAPTAPVAGSASVAELLLGFLETRPVRFVVAEVNGEPGVVVVLGERVVTTLVLRVAEGRVDHIHAVGNPEKLRHLNADRPWHQRGVPAEQQVDRTGLPP